MKYEATLGDFQGTGSIIHTVQGSRPYLKGEFYPSPEDLKVLMQREREKMIFKGMMIDDATGKALALIETRVTVFYVGTNEHIELEEVQEPVIVEKLGSW